LLKADSLMAETNLMSLTRRIVAGDMRALASAMTLIESGDPKAKTVIKAIYPRTGKAHVIGVTGAAGTGKSSLIDRLTAEYRQHQKRVGILAVDPSSLFSSGALLGDRVRMRDHFLDAGVFIRSFATRGSAGGLSAAVRDAVHLLDGAGKDIIIVETIGVGQDELEIAALAHTVVVVLMPEIGDEVQGMKAGIAEIADILALNKADLPGAEQTIQQLEALFGDDNIPIVPTSAVQNEGTHLLVKNIDEHRVKSAGNGSYWRKRVKLCRQELLALLRERVFAHLAKKVSDQALDRQAERIAERRIDPYSVVEELAKKARL
jgi:LAO/AO transport system kinase